MERENKLDVLILIILIGFTIAVGYHYFQGYYLGKPYPQNTFLFTPQDKFNDFYNPVRGSEDLDPFRPDKINYKGGYPPFGYLVAYLFSLIVPRTLSWLVFILSFFLAFFFLLKYFLYGREKRLGSHQYLSLFVLTFLTYPVIFAVDRSNFDLIICIMIFLFVFFYQGKKFLLSTIFLGIAIAIKPFVGLLLLIYLYDKKFKEAGILLLNVLLLTVLSLSLFKDGLVIETQKFLYEMLIVSNLITGGAIARFSSDLYSFLAILTPRVYELFGKIINPMTSSKFKLVYSMFAFTTLGCFALFLWKKHQPFWKTLLILTSLAILLPFSSGDYRLTYLFPPLVLFITNDEKRNFDLPIIILWGLLLVSKNYYILAGEQNIGMLLNPILLILILILSLFNISKIKVKSM